MQKMKMRDLSNNLTFAEGQEEYIRDCKVRNLRAGTIRHWTDSFTNMCHYISPDTLITDFDEDTMPEFILAHRDKELSDMALYTYCRDLRTLLYFFMKQGWLREFKVEIPKCSKTPVETYTDEESSLLLKKPNVKTCSFSEYKAWARRGKIPDTVSIHERSKGAENRSRYGHWESDTVLGMRKTGCIVTHVERKSGFLVAAKIPDRQDNAFNNATINAFADIPDKLKKSFTVDNRKEFAAHKQLAAATGMKVYFCDPYSPWQRGTNENTNGLLRQFFPKSTSFADITDEMLAEVVDLIKNRPRKRLGYLSPAEVIHYFFLLFCCT